MRSDVFGFEIYNRILKESAPSFTFIVIEFHNMRKAKNTIKIYFEQFHNLTQ